MHNGEPWKEKSRNLRPKPIISGTKQVVQGDGWKSWKDTKPRRGFSYYHNCSTQHNDGLNSLKSHWHPIPAICAYNQKRRTSNQKKLGDGNIVCYK
jgi:hypothetical protein